MATSEELVVIGAGFGRTGTLSMKAALEQVGLGPCHHMFEVFARPDDFSGWAAAVRGAPWDRQQLLGGFRSTLDFPACLVWEELFRAAPASKVLLTVRSSESWWASFDATIGRELGKTDFGPPYERASELFGAITDVVFGGRPDDEATAVAAFEAHNQAVIDVVPPDRLLVYELGSGWEPVCAFLGVDVPDEPFPKSNTTEEFLAGRGDAATDAATDANG